jgi:SAM-dependent methyltransferase
MIDAGDPMLSLEGRSELLRDFVAAAPLERTSIYLFVAEQARLLEGGDRILDVGAGEAPYRELFGEHQYLTLDRLDTPHSGAVDIHGDADSIPVADGSFDAVLCTQVLEHVPDPGSVLREFRRVLRRGGRLIATVPLLWEEHETPYDYYRYTRYGAEHLLRSAGFDEVEVRPRTDSFTTLAQLVLNARWSMGTAPDGLDGLRAQAREALEQLAGALVSFSPLDVDMVMPLGFSMRATAADHTTS